MSTNTIINALRLGVEYAEDQKLRLHCQRVEGAGDPKWLWERELEVEADINLMTMAIGWLTVETGR